ncbi:hypothetical protein GCK72_008061 [Caenorhabditis remanei]|uniref:Uncharacterized protein n=1 Tax=Caenorhabditis remanei TaxID=31234 RepID=A0A6A5HIV2_CAERE|nr:hypothetical protein GCK72_008061 [Caenorhabditis remanei]KAF1768100.1 hypothetical protein GCK72_008061 [Caenorhabditis remanei]
MSEKMFKREENSRNDGEELSIELESDDDPLKNVTATDIVKFQTTALEELCNTLEEGIQYQHRIIQRGDEMVEYYNEYRDEIVDSMAIVWKRGLRAIKNNKQRIDWALNKFRIDLRKILWLYVTVNHMMDEEEKNAAKQDEFVEILDEAEKEIGLFKDNVNLQDLFGAKTAGVVPSQTKLSRETLVNHIVQPYKPIETEVATHVSNVNRLISDILCKTPKRVLLAEITKPLQKQGQTVAEMILKEFPPKTVEDFIQTLPVKQRD